MTKWSHGKPFSNGYPKDDDDKNHLNVRADRISNTRQNNLYIKKTTLETKSIKGVDQITNGGRPGGGQTRLPEISLPTEHLTVAPPNRFVHCDNQTDVGIKVPRARGTPGKGVLFQVCLSSRF